MTALFIGSEIYRRSSYGSKHPLAIARVSTVIDLCRALGWLPEARYIDSPMASVEELARFHARDYIAAVREAERCGAVSAETGRRYGLGRNGNPIFPEVFSRPATACGGSLLAARLLSGAPAAAQVVYNPAGGTHHGRPAEAAGFCYFNDPVLAIMALLDRGAERVFYLDIDAHHGDGVQAAVHDDQRVMTVSVHEEGRWPMVAGGAGESADRGGGNARNIPVPAAFNDSEMDFVLENAILPLLSDFEPSAVVLQGGADGLAEDPLSRLALSNRALWRVVEAVKPYAPRFLVLGGGGYNPWAVARCWTGIWAVLDGHEVPDRLPTEAEAVLRGLRWRRGPGRNPPPEWSTTLADNARPGPLREEVRAGVRAALS